MAHALLVIQDSTLQAMANNQAFVREFPFLRSLTVTAPKGRRGCSKCSASNHLRAGVFQTVKGLLAGMSGDKKSKLKALLNAHQVRIIYRRQDKKVVEHTF